MCVCCVEGSTIVSSCFPEVSLFLFFKLSLYFSFAQVFFYFLIFCSLDHLKVRNFLSLEITLWSTIVWFVLRGPLLCPAASWGDFVSNISFTFSFAKVFSFTFLVSFMWTSQKCPISQNIGYLIKTQLKNSTQTIFKGVVHEQPWSTIVWFVWGVHYCVQRLPEVFCFKQSLYLFLCY